jgi:hypothetical protein
MYPPTFQNVKLFANEIYTSLEVTL